MTRVGRKASTAPNISTEQKSSIPPDFSRVLTGKGLRKCSSEGGICEETIWGKRHRGVCIFCTYRSMQTLLDFYLNTDHAELVFRSRIRLIPYSSIHYSKCEINNSPCDTIYNSRSWYLTGESHVR